MNDLTHFLGKLELSDMEAKLYLKLLETGPVGVSDLAKAVGIKRTSTYIYLEPLFAKGLVTKIVNKSKKQVAPADPENLETLIDQKLASTKALKEQFPDVLQDIKQAFPGFTEITNVEITSYKGIQNARKIYLEALRSDELRAYVKIKETEKLFPENIPVFENAFKNNKKLRVWEIIYDTNLKTKDAVGVQGLTDRYFYKFMPKHLKLSSEDILMYDGKVAIINYRGGGTSVVLQSADFYHNFKALFDFMWEVLAEPNFP